MSCTISICDVPLRAVFASRGPVRKRRTALSWASSETSTACSTAASISSFSIDGILPLAAPVRLQSQSRGYQNQSTSVNQISDLRTRNIQTPAALRQEGDVYSY